MRFDSLTLVRYGNFTEERVDFPAPASGAPDLHIVCGPNEAGKTVLRAALVDFLYGIPNRSTMNFVHEHGMLQICARVSAGRKSAELVRTKGSRNTLRDAAGRVAEDAPLTDLLGPVDRAQYMARFALGHDDLREQSEKMLGSDLAGIFYASASGLRMFTERRKRLTEGAAKLGAPRSRKKTRLKELIGKLAEVDGTIREQTLSPYRRGELLDAKNKSAGRLRQAREDYGRLAGEQARLMNLAGAAEIIADIASCERQIAALGERRGQSGAKDGATAFINAQRAITELHEKGIAARKHLTDIGKRESEIRRHEGKAAEIALELGWKFGDAQGLASMLPVEHRLAAVEDQLGELGEAKASFEVLQRETDNARQDFHSARDACPGAPGKQQLRRLERALKNARRLGDAQMTISERQDGVDEAGAGFARTLAKLRPWAGQISELMKMTLPDADLCGQYRDEFQRLHLRRDELNKKLHEIGAVRARQRARLTARKRKLGPVSAEDLQSSRKNRDKEFARLCGSGLRNGAQSTFRQLVTAADELADRRFACAEQLAELDKLAEEEASSQSELEEVGAQLREVKNVLHETETRWNALAETAGLAGMQPAGVAGWNKQRELALELDEKRELHAGRLSTFKRRAAEATAELAQCLPDAAEQDSSDVAASLESLVERAELLLRQSAVSDDRASQLRQQERRAQAADRQLQQYEANIGALCDKLEMLLGECGLGGAGDHAVVLPMLRRVREMAAEIKLAQGLRTDRVMPMRRDLNDFAGLAASLAIKLAPEIADDEPAAVAAQLHSKLEEERLSLDRLGELQKHLTDLNSKLAGLAGDAGVEELRGNVNGRLAKELRALAEQAGRDVEAAGGNVARLGVEAGKTEQDLEKSFASDGKDVAQLESRRQQIIASVADTADEYLGMMIAEKMLCAALEMYRKENASPMLDNASRLFSKLAGGRYGRLTLDQDENRLLSELAGGTETRHAGQLSEGTRDQLYLALRLAGLGDDLDAGRTLPFIADDLFITFDDRRASAGFAVLAEFAKKTQLIYLTHHDHLAELAQKTVPGAHVRHLPALPPQPATGA